MLCSTVVSSFPPNSLPFPPSPLPPSPPDLPFLSIYRARICTRASTLQLTYLSYHYPVPSPAAPPPADFGYLTLAAGFVHGILHCVRFSVANQAWIITDMDTGRSGVVACILLLPIVLPMKFDWFKKRVRESKT